MYYVMLLLLWGLNVVMYKVISIVFGFIDRVNKFVDINIKVKFMF